MKEKGKEPRQQRGAGLTALYEPHVVIAAESLKSTENGPTISGSPHTNHRGDNSMTDLRKALSSITPTDAEMEKRKTRKSQYPIPGITRDELAARLEVNVRTLDYWLAGKTHPNRSVVREIERWAQEDESHCETKKS